MSYFIGTNPESVGDGFIKRYFYGLRRNDDGELFLIRIDQMSPDGIAVINEPGITTEDFLDFEEGIGFLEGIDADHNVVYDNLRYPQIKWDGRRLTYYVNPEDGYFVVRIAEDYQYPEGISAPGY